MASRPLKHGEVQTILGAIADAKIVNLDASINSLIQPTAAAMKNIGDEVSLHVLCCNEYGLVTAATANLDISEIRQELQSLKDALTKG